MNDKIGLDTAITNGDLALDSTGQLICLKGSLSLAESLKRRISTDLSGYARAVYTAEELQILNPDYGSALSQLLSTPISLLESSTADIEQAILEDPRVAQVACSLEITLDSKANFNVSYAINENYLSQTGTTPTFTLPL